MTDPALRILVIEDHAALGRFIAAAFTAAGWTVCGPVAESAAALQAAQDWSIDVAVIDWLLNGAATDPILETLMARGVPCVLMSGHPRSTLPEPLRELPFLFKPFTMAELLAAVRAATVSR